MWRGETLSIYNNNIITYKGAKAMSYAEQLKDYLNRTEELIIKYEGDKSIQNAFYHQAFGAADLMSRILWEQEGTEGEEKARKMWEEYSAKFTKMIWG